MAQGPADPQFRVAIDFGTTFTTIAFVRCPGSKELILTIEEFPGDRNVSRNGTQVPSEIWYPTSKLGGSHKRKSTNQSSGEALYGYEVWRHLELSDSDPEKTLYDESTYVTKPKLLLEKSAHLQGLRSRTMSVIQRLKENKLIREDRTVITDLLTCYLKHTKKILARDYNLELHDQGTMHLDNVPRLEGILMKCSRGYVLCSCLLGHT